MRSHILRPAIVVGQSEHTQLFTLASGSQMPAAESLLMEMERARIVPDHKVPQDVVRIGSRVQYRTDKDELVDVTLVYPARANISLGRISVLTPVGAALIGLRTGQSITYEARDGRRHVVTVLSVMQTADEPAEA
ncbi:MAG: nucleoside diphosphate kinase regulator [Devosia sp.]|jgi:regulator of nucleoside diphosphate kinase